MYIFIRNLKVNILNFQIFRYFTASLKNKTNDENITTIMAEEYNHVPEVMVEIVRETNTITEQNIDDSKEGQLKRPPSAVPRNRSPVTIQEWVDSLPAPIDQKYLLNLNNMLL